MVPRAPASSASSSLARRRLAARPARAARPRRRRLRRGVRLRGAGGEARRRPRRTEAAVRGTVRTGKRQHGSMSLSTKVTTVRDVSSSRTADLSSGVDVVHATKQVCRQAEKMSEKKLYDIIFCNTFMQTRDMYLHFTRSNMWANGNNLNFSSRVKTR